MKMLTVLLMALVRPARCHLALKGTAVSVVSAWGGRGVHVR